MTPTPPVRPRARRAAPCARRRAAARDADPRARRDDVGEHGVDQYRGIEVEAAERVRAQGEWLLNGAIDWSRLILREDARQGGADYIGEPWSLPLAETRLSTFLAAATADNSRRAPTATPAPTPSSPARSPTPRVSTTCRS
jgi:hypothetical protein